MNTKVSTIEEDLARAAEAMRIIPEKLIKLEAMVSRAEAADNKSDPERTKKIALARDQLDFNKQRYEHRHAEVMTKVNVIRNGMMELESIVCGVETL